MEGMAPLSKGKARRDLIRLVRHRPLLTKPELARRLGISRQRVAELLILEGLAVPKGQPGRPKSS